VADSDLAMAATDSVADAAAGFDSAMMQAYLDSVVALTLAAGRARR
jgi:hypothetical protein